MAMTAAQKTDAYRFFAIAFNAAPGATYMSQLFDAYTAGMTTKQIVNVYTTKPEFTATYPIFLSDTDFATKLVNNIVKAAATAAAKTEAVNDIVASLALGQSRGDVIYTIFNNLANKALTDATWGNTAKQMANQVTVSQYYTETLVGNSTTLSVLQGVIANVTNTTDVSTNAAIEAAIAGAGGVGQTFTLTTGVDSFTGASGNDTFNGSDTTYTGLDVLKGGTGTDTLNLSDVKGDTLDVSIATVSDIETLNLTSVKGLGAAKADVSGWTGLTSATFNLQSVAADQTITSAGTTAVALTSKVTTAANVTLTGGSTISVTQSNTVNNAGKTVTVNGTKTLTTAVTVTQTESTATWAAKVDVLDPNQGSGKNDSKIATVTIDGLTGGVAQVKSDALATLTVKNSTKDVTVTNATASHTLALGLNKVTGGTIKDAAATTLNVTTDGASKALTLDFGAVTAATFAGSASLSATVTAGALKTATITGAGGLTADLSGATVTGIDASAATGANTIIVDGTKATYTGGSGKDTVTVAASPTKAIDGGAGTTDELVKNAADFTTAKAVNFEVLGLGTAATGSYDATGYTGLHIASTVTAAVTFANVAAGAALAIDAVPGQDVTYTLKDATGKTDSVALTFATATDTGLNFSGKNVDVSGIETVSVSSLGDGTGVNQIKLVDTSATALTVTGVPVTLTLAGATKLASLDASAVTEKTANTLTNDLSAVAFTAGATIKGSLTVKNVITGGVGADTITGGAAVDTITGGGGLDILTGNGGNDTFTLGISTSGNAYATITDATKGDMINLKDTVATFNTFTATKLTGLGGTAVFQDWIDLATVSAAATVNAGIVSWFQFGGDTYLVEDHSANTTFSNGVDSVIKLTGLVDLSTATIDGAVTSVLTLG